MPVKRYRMAKSYFGKRGFACLWFGVVFLILGYSFGHDVTPQLQMNLEFLTNVMPLEVWSGIWMLGGVVFLVAAFWKRLRLIAFMIGVAVTANWSIGIAIQSAFGEASRGYANAIIYFLFAALILLIATWDEPVANVEIGEKEDGRD